MPEIGSCETTVEHANWNITLREINFDRSIGNVIKTTVLPATFDKDWGDGQVTIGHNDRIRLYGIMDIAVTRHGPVSFRVAGDDGYRLFISGGGLDSKEIISDWGDHSYREQQIVMNLQPGIYRLNLDYYEWAGKARLSFDVNSNVVGWHSIGDCTGDVSVTPEGPFTVLKMDAPPTNVAERFQIGVNDLLVADYPDAPDWALVPGPSPQPLARKIIVIQGVDSESKPEEYSVPIQSGSLSSRVGTIVAAIQSNAWDINSGLDSAIGRVAVIDPRDVITFSYSGDYFDTLEGKPIPVENHSGRSHHVADYKKTDTCTGVAAGASKLDLLIKQLVGQDSDVRIDLVAHSMGGLVSAYMLATRDGEHLDHIRSVTTLDSPLRGTKLVNFLNSECLGEQAWRDLKPDSAVVTTIAELNGSPIARKFGSIRSLIGWSLPGEATLNSLCAGQLDVIHGHTCVWNDLTTLSVIGNAVNFDRPSIAQLRWLDEDGAVVQAVDDGETVFLFAPLWGVPDNEEVPVKIYEVDPFDEDDLMATGHLVVRGGVGRATWRAEWSSDFLGFGGDPEYKFVVLDMDSPMLIVRQK